MLSRRDDSTYWHDNRRPETIPDRLLDLLEFWRHQPPSRYDLNRVEEVFPSASYQFILYGMGFTDPGGEDEIPPEFESDAWWRNRA